MHKDSTGQSMNQVMTPFQQRFGKRYLCRATFLCGKKCVNVEEYGGFSAEHSTNIPNSDLCCDCHFHCTITTQVCSEMISGAWTMCDHKRDLVMK